MAAELRADTSKHQDRTHTPSPNITIEEAKAIKELRTHQSGIILTVDKGTAMVFMDRQDYNCKALELLDDKDTYKPIFKDPTPKYKSQLINVLKSCKTQGQITQDTYNKLYPTCVSTQILWLTPNPQNRHLLRPRVYSRGSITYRVPKEMANIL